MYEPIKKLGQNFLTDVGVAHRMVDALDISGQEDVVEIGPGLGALTEILARKTEKNKFDLIAVEVDRRLYEKLHQMFFDNPNVHIVNEDILSFLPKFKTDRPLKIIGSLPFYITSPIIHLIIKMDPRPTDTLMMIQREVALKIIQIPPDANYMSSFVQTFFTVNYLETVQSAKFNPRPEVDAAVVVLRKKASPIENNMIEKYEGFLHRAYSNPRKMLNKVFTKDELAIVGIEASLRAQNVGVGTWVELFKKICLSQ